MKKAAIACTAALAAAQAFTAPERHPAYEPDGKPASGTAVQSQNLFLRAKVSASGQWDKCKPALAVDGNRDGSTYWAAENLPQSLTVDMGAEKTLSEVLLVPYWKDGRVYGFKIECSRDGKTWTMLADRTDNSICAGAPGFPVTFDPVQTRYVRTTFTSNSRGAKTGAHIVEIEGRAAPSVAGETFFKAGDIHKRYDRDTPLKPDGLAPVVKLAGWRGERVNAMLVAHSPGGFSELRLSAKDPKAKLNILRYTLGDGVLYADILDGLSQTEFKGVTRPAVYSYDIPRDATGVIKDTVTATINGKPFALPVEITVIPRTLPPVAKWSFHLDIWQHPDAIARWHDVPFCSQDHLRLLSRYNKVLADMGQKTITATLIDEAWNRQTYDRFRSGVEIARRADGSWKYDFTAFDKLVETMQAAGVTGQIDCYSMLPWSLEFRYFDETLNRHVAPRMQPGSAQYEDFWGHLLAALVKHVKEKGWYERTKIALDERPDRLVKPALAVLRKYAPGLGLVSACNRPSKLNDEMFDVSYTFRLNEQLKDVAARRRAEGKFTTFYICCGPALPNTFMHSDPAEAEWLPAYAAAWGFDGMLRWAWCSWVADPFRSQDFTAWPSGDTSLVYPGPRLSLRAVLLRDGIETFEKIKILGGDFPELKRFTFKRSQQKGVHSADVRALNNAVNSR